MDIAPEAGVNPFRAGAVRGDRGTYTVDLVPGPVPASGRAPNTLYAGSGLNGEQPPAVTFIYRIYLAEGDPTGGAGLPQAELVAGDGASAPGEPLPSCQAAPELPGGVNDAVAAESFPAEWPQGAPAASAEPQWGLARSGSSGNQVGPLNVRGGNPFFPNFDNVYLSLLVQRDRGSVVAFRAKAPTFVRTRGESRFGRGQLRYWSICTNDQPSTRYVACLADEDAKVDAEGYVNVVISDPAHKPKLDAQDNWLPWGPYTDVFVLYRHMLPAADFAQAAQRVPAGAPPAQSMGEYHPQTVVCGTGAFTTDRCGLPVPALPRPAAPAPVAAAAPAPAPAAARAPAKRAKKKRVQRRRCGKARAKRRARSRCVAPQRKPRPVRKTRRR